MKKIIIFMFLIIGLNSFALKSGEKLTFKIKYGIIGAGKATLELTETSYQDSVPSYLIQSEARTNKTFDKIYKVRDYMESVWRKEDLVALRFTKRLREGKYRQHRIHFYYPELNMTMYTKFGRKTKRAKTKKIEIPDNTQDIFSAFYLFRTYDLKVGEEYVINVSADGRNYPAKILVHKKEKIKTALGKKECFVVEPVLEGDAIFKQTGKIQIWITADEDRIPVLMSSQIIFGKFKAILTDVEYN